MTNEETAIKQHLSKPRPIDIACCCLGAQDEEPRCPCKMQWIEKVNNEWYEINEIRSETGITFSATKI